MSNQPIPSSLLPPFRVLPEPQLVFGTTDPHPTHVNPLLGLSEFGPFATVPGGGAVRVATITVAGAKSQLYEFLRGLRMMHEPTDRKTYVPRFPGFQDVMKIDIVPAGAHVDLPLDLGNFGDHAQNRIVTALGRAISQLMDQRDQWDVVAFLLPRSWERWRISDDRQQDLHDRLKAIAAPLGCPVQMIREASALEFRYKASLAWRLSLAFFVKAGGVPWRVQRTTPEETAYIGLSYAIRGGTSNSFVTCCSQVLDSEGGGMEFVAYNIGVARDLENPHLTRDEMRAVMARSAHLYQLRHAGRMPRRLSVHKNTRWRMEEVEGVMDAWSATADIECITIQRSDWRGVILDRAESGSKPASWPVDRGTLQQLSGKSALLWVNATARSASLQGGPYNPNVKGLPSPLLVIRDAGHGPFEITGADLLALSTLDWNNDAPFDSGPVTIEYSRRLASIIAHVPELPDNIYHYRLFM